MASSSNSAEFNSNNEGQGVTKNINSPTYNEKCNITTQIVQPSKSYLEIVNKYLKNKKIFVPNVNGNQLRITSAMLKQTPIVERISYEQLEDPSAKYTNNRKRTTDIADILINEDDPNETIAIIGGSGSGKSVCASMILQFYIDQEKFPFLINMKDINDDNILLEFVEFLQSYSSTNLSNPNDVVDLIRENEEDCIFIVDGLDQSQKKPFPFGDFQPQRDGKMTAFSWLSRLFEKRKMENSKIIFTSREASMSKLADSFKPFQPYSLKGFTGEGMKLAIKVLDKNADVDPVLP